MCDDDYDDTGHIAVIDLADSMDIEADIEWDLSETIDIQPVEVLSDDQASDFNVFTEDITKSV